MFLCMRTTLSIDDDVTVLIATLRRERRLSLKAIVNEGLRQGLRVISGPKPARQPFHTQETALGRCLLPTIDDVSETLATAEGESFR